MPTTEVTRESAVAEFKLELNFREHKYPEYIADPHHSLTADAADLRLKIWRAIIKVLSGEVIPPPDYNYDAMLVEIQREIVKRRKFYGYKVSVNKMNKHNMKRKIGMILGGLHFIRDMAGIKDPVEGITIIHQGKLF